MAEAGADVLAVLRDLRHSVTTEAAALIDRWHSDIELASFEDSAANLAHYLALRHHDLRDLQRELMRHGLSSLGRLESRVLITLDAVECALAGLLSGTLPAPDWPPSAAAFFGGEMRLLANAHALLGGAAGDGAGRIMVTLPTEAAEDPAFLLEIVRCGADVVRINCAHDDADTWAAMIANTRRAGEAVGRRIPVLMDIAGPKFRIGAVRREPGVRLVAGDRFRLVADAGVFSGDAMIEAVCDPADVLEHVGVGTEVALDDGRLSGVVEACHHGCATVRVERTQRKGFKMKPECPSGDFPSHMNRLEAGSGLT
jgi:pyruvate kinase